MHGGSDKYDNFTDNRVTGVGVPSFRVQFFSNSNKEGGGGGEKERDIEKRTRHGTGDHRSIQHIQT